MRKRLTTTLLLSAAMLSFAVFLSKSSAVAAASPSPVVASAATDCEVGGSFFGLKPWYYYLPDTEIGVNRMGDAPVDKCGIKCFNIFVQNAPNACGQTGSDIPGVILAIVDDLLRIVSIVAVFFIIIGSFQFTGSRGNAERTANARSTVMNAIIGLAISLVSLGVISFIGNQLH